MSKVTTKEPYIFLDADKLNEMQSWRSAWSELGRTEDREWMMKVENSGS